MHVLLVGPDHEDNLSLRYLSAALLAAGHGAELTPFNSAADLPQVVAAARDHDLVGLSLCFQSRAREFLALAEALKADGCPLIVVGGHFATCAAEELLRRNEALDVVVLHEGEGAIVELADAGTDRRAWAGIDGIAYRDGGQIRLTGTRRALDDLDALPFPDRRGSVHLFAGVPTAYLMGSRGCVARCDYCCIMTLHRVVPGKRFRQRDPARVVEEMSQLYHERGIRQFVFHDDNFLVPSVRANHRRLDALQREIERRGLEDIGLVIKCRPPDVEPTVFRRLRQMGLLRVFLGIESGSAAGLASIGRHQTVDDSERALEICDELGISAQYTMMMFHPDATLQTVRADLAFMERHIDHALNFCRTEIYAGTPLERRMIAEGRARGDYLSRTYRIADGKAALACDVAIDLFRERCWTMGGLMERTIGLDHLSAVVGHFYTGGGRSQRRRALGITDAVAKARLAVNRDLVALLGELIDAVAGASGADDPELLARVRALRRRERDSRDRLVAEITRARQAMDAFILPTVGLRRDRGLRLLRDAQPHRLARHAAAVALAFSVAAGGAGCENQRGVSEFAAPPLEDAEPSHGPSEHPGISEMAAPPLEEAPAPAPTTPADEPAPPVPEQAEGTGQTPAPEGSGQAPLPVPEEGGLPEQPGQIEGQAPSDDARTEPDDPASEHGVGRPDEDAESRPSRGRPHPRRQPPLRELPGISEFAAPPLLEGEGEGPGRSGHN